LDRQARAQRKRLFGRFSEGFRRLRPYRWQALGLHLLEIPVTTMPVCKLPIHLSYILYLGQFSRSLAIGYFRLAIAMCRLFRVEPSILLHPLDFMGAEDDTDLGFFPGMKLPAEQKLILVAAALDHLQSRFQVVTMTQHAARYRPRAPANSVATA
jgi:hypothetical protein